MPRHSADPTLMPPDRDPRQPATRWLYGAIRQAIRQGRLRPGKRLPATRELALRYGLSRGTIVAAFDQLRSEGYLEARTGSGTFVTSILPERMLHAPRAFAPSPPVQHHPPRRLSEYGRRLRLFPNLRPGPIRAFRTDQPALDLFPTTLWAQIATRRLRLASVDLLLACGPLGYRPLQEAVADYLTTSRGVVCTAEQVAIVSGSQEALDLVARLVLDPGDRVVIENPGYIGATLAFEALGATLVPAGVDGDGIILDDASLRGARLVYLTPAHQF